MANFNRHCERNKVIPHIKLSKHQQTLSYKGHIPLMGVSLIEGTEQCCQWLRATRNAFSFPLDRDSPELRYRVRP